VAAAEGTGSPEHFDAIVVGSGFGGSVVTYRLAEAGRRVCLLERGRSYPPGSFPRTPAALRRNFWDPSEGVHGLFQVWAFPGIESVVSAGLGGGSLIYANVLIRKDEKWFVREDRAQPGYEYWPVTRADLEPHYDRVEAMMRPQRYPIGAEPYASTPKTVAFREAAAKAGYDWFLPNLAVTFANEGQRPVPGEPIVDAGGGTTDNLHGRTRYTCQLVGECDLGCNYGSKNSLDYTYLSAAQRSGATLRTLCEVRELEALPAGGFEVRYTEHTPDGAGGQAGQPRPPLTRVRADRVILSAGVFGSTFLLLSNRERLPGLSGQLGRRFSGNGDLLGFVLPRKARAGSSPVRDLDPMRGPVITSSLRFGDTLDGDTGRGFYLQEGGFPDILGWVLEAADTPNELVRAARFVGRQVWSALTRSPNSDFGGELRQVLGDAHLSSGMMVMLGMGRDVPDGVMSLKGKWLELDWHLDGSRAYFERVKDAMGRMAAELGGDFRINPLWYFRKLVTVHGVGGCPMGRDAAEGVVDSYGEVFGQPGLWIADGSVMPGPVGPNPSLTIAAQADRCADRILGLL
jgi:cholesterol oxidase